MSEPFRRSSSPRKRVLQLVNEVKQQGRDRLTRLEGPVSSVDHSIYTLVDGTRDFTGVIVGVTPTGSTHLATKGYVDGVAGSRAVVSKSGTYTATASDHVILCDATGGSWTLTLPASSGNSGLDYFIKLNATSGGPPNTLTVDGNGAELIDGAANYQMLDMMRTGIHIVCDGTGWHILTSYLAG